MRRALLYLTALVALSAGPMSMWMSGRHASPTVRTADIAVATALLLPPATTSTTSPPRPVTYIRHWGAHRGYPDARTCVSMSEHGGAYDRSSNPSHFGRYQFSRSAWVSFGGDPSTWGIASPAEQDAMFNRAWSLGPAVQYGQWLEWDGC